MKTKAEDSPQQMVIDFSSYDLERGRKTRPSRHVRPKGEVRLACGHLPQDGDYVQIPISIKAFLQLTDCNLCRSYLEGVAAHRVVARSKTPASNTGVNFLGGGG